MATLGLIPEAIHKYPQVSKRRDEDYMGRKMLEMQWPGK